MKTIAASIEPLESRIAPAILIGQVITFHDVDHDLVKITASSGTLGALVSSAGDAQLLSLSAVNAPHANITVTVTKAPGGDGLVNIGKFIFSGVDVGNVSIPGDVAEITGGSGSATTPAIASLSVHSLGQLGGATGAGANGDGTYESDITGSIKSLKVAANVDGMFLNITGNLGSASIGGSLVGEGTKNSGQILTSGSMGALKIGGSVIGGDANGSGDIISNNGIASLTIGGSVYGYFQNSSGYILNNSAKTFGPIKIGGDVEGASGDFSGTINSFGPITSVAIGGSLIGGSGTDSGALLMQNVAASLGPVTIKHDIEGGFKTEAGTIKSTGTIKSVTIGGNLVGNGQAGTDSGEIESGGDMGVIKIAGDIKGGKTTNSGSVTSGGKLTSVTVGGSEFGTLGGNIEAAKDIGSVKIGNYCDGEVTSTSGGLSSLYIGGNLDGGNIIGAGGAVGTVFIGGSILDSTSVGSTNAGIKSVYVGGSIDDNSGIICHDDLGSVKVMHNVNGGSIYSSNGNIGKVSVGGDFILSDVNSVTGSITSVTIGGSMETSQILAGTSATNVTPITIGTVKVAGDFIASSVSAGFNNGGDGYYGNANDHLVAQSGKIASIVVGGQIIGTSVGGDFYGFDAQSIGSFKVGTNTILLPPAPNDVPLSFITGDVAIHLA